MEKWGSRYRVAAFGFSKDELHDLFGLPSSVKLKLFVDDQAEQRLRVVVYSDKLPKQCEVRKDKDSLLPHLSLREIRDAVASPNNSPAYIKVGRVTVFPRDEASENNALREAMILAVAEQRIVRIEYGNGYRDLDPAELMAAMERSEADRGNPD